MFEFGILAYYLKKSIHFEQETLERCICWDWWLPKTFWISKYCWIRGKERKIGTESPLILFLLQSLVPTTELSFQIQAAKTLASTVSMKLYKSILRGSLIQRRGTSRANGSKTRVWKFAGSLWKEQVCFIIPPSWIQVIFFIRGFS